MPETQHALSPADVQQHLKSLRGWTVKDKSLVKTFSFPDYLPGADFVHDLAIAAEKADHHPLIVLDIKKVTVTWSTHSAGGITGMDFDGARTADRLAAG